MVLFTTKSVSVLMEVFWSTIGQLSGSFFKFLALDLFLYPKLQLYGFSVLKRVLEVEGTWQSPTRHLYLNDILFPSF